MSKNKSNSKIAQPYAEALIDIAISSKQLDNITDDMTNIVNLIEQSSEIEKVVNNPLVDNKVKKEILKQIFRNQVSNTTLKFIMLIVDRKRTSFLKDIGRNFLELAYLKNGITVAQIATSTPFNEQQYNLLLNKVQAITKAKKVQMNISIDPDLIGGFTIQIGSKLIDSSLKGQLKQIASHLDIITV